MQLQIRLKAKKALKDPWKIDFILSGMSSLDKDPGESKEKMCAEKWNHIHTDKRLDGHVTCHHQQNADLSAEFARLLETFFFFSSNNCRIIIFH